MNPVIDRRELLTFWRRRRRVPDEPPTIARLVEPTPIDEPAPFSLEAFYAARRGGRNTP